MRNSSIWIGNHIGNHFSDTLINRDSPRKGYLDVLITYLLL